MTNELFSLSSFFIGDFILIHSKYYKIVKDTLYPLCCILDDCSQTRNKSASCNQCEEKKNGTVIRRYEVLERAKENINSGEILSFRYSFLNHTMLEKVYIYIYI